MIFQNLAVALQCVFEQRRRATLSALGVMVGTIAIVLLVSIALGVQKDVKGQVEDLGVNVLVVIPGRVGEDTMFSPNIAGLSYLKDEDMTRVSKLPGVRTVAPLMFVGGGIRYQEKLSPTSLVLAAGSSWFQIHPVHLAEGATYGESEENKNVVVIGALAKKNLFGDQPAVGKKVTINEHEYTVIGVTENKKTESSLFSMGSFENVVYIPYAFAKTQTESPMLHRIMIQTRPDIDPKTLVQSVDQTLGERLDRQQYSVLTQEDLLKLVFKIMGILTWLLTGLTSIALFVGGVGIMTVMLMSVSERASEIGIRKAVGAGQWDIFMQFLWESILLTLGGGLVGFLISWLVCLWLAAATPIKPEITLGVIELSFGTSMVVGCFFGILPAMRAARQDPISALRI